MDHTRNDSPPYTKCAENVLQAEAELIGTPRSNLSGLALSGGGIRSAAFALGVLQALVKDDALSKFDYLSTVSGGGFVGCSLTWWLRRGLPNGCRAGTSPSSFPFGSLVQTENSDAQNRILDFLRFHGSYLAPNRHLNTFSIFAILLRNALVSLSVYLTALILLMFVISSALLLLDGFALREGPVLRDVPGAEWIHTLVDSVYPSRTPRNDSHEANKAISGRIFELCLYLCWFFLASSFLYSVFTLYYQVRQNRDQARDARASRRKPSSKRKEGPKWSHIRYTGRTKWQGRFGVMLRSIAVLAGIGVLPIIDSLLRNIGDSTEPGPHILFLVVLFGASILFVFMPFDANMFKGQRRGQRLVKTLGAVLSLYALLVAAYAPTVALITPLYRATSADDNAFFSALVTAVISVIYILVVAAALVVVLVLVGRSVNVNYLGVHRMYRDRLMEVFLPNAESVMDQKWGLATDANSALIEGMCQRPNVKPYQIINTNVVLVDSVNENIGSAVVIVSSYRRCIAEATRRGGFDQIGT